MPHLRLDDEIAGLDLEQLGSSVGRVTVMLARMTRVDWMEDHATVMGPVAAPERR